MVSSVRYLRGGEDAVEDGHQQVHHYGAVLLLLHFLQSLFKEETSSEGASAMLYVSVPVGRCWRDPPQVLCRLASAPTAFGSTHKQGVVRVSALCM